MSTFETKEEYLKYLAGWKAATNAEEAKSKRIVCDHVQYNWSYHWNDEDRARLVDKGYTLNKSGNQATLKDGGHYKETGWLDAHYYVFNNVMRGKDPKRGFTPKSERKVQYPNSPWSGFTNAAYALERVIQDAEQYVEHLGKGKGHKTSAGSTVKTFLVPFGGKIEIADLLRIDKEELANARRFHR